jgi:hypothetical protein
LPEVLLLDSAGRKIVLRGPAGRKEMTVELAGSEGIAVRFQQRIFKFGAFGLLLRDY